MSDDDDMFGDFDDRMNSVSPPKAVHLESDDSFEDAQQEFGIDRVTLIDKYQKLKEESKKLDEIAIEVRTLIMICKKMEECYTNRINRTDTPVSFGEVRYLHDGSSIVLITIHNITNQPMVNWTLCIRPSSVFPSTSSSTSQNILLGTILPGVQKTFKCSLDFEALPLLVELSLERDFQLEEVQKIFHVDIDPICVTMWNQAQIVEEKKLDASFTSSIRLPNSLINLLSGSPDTVIQPTQVLKSILNLDSSVGQVSVCIPLSAVDDVLCNIQCKKDGAQYHQISIGTENSQARTLLAEHLRIRLIFEMSKLKSRPVKKGDGVSILAELDATSLEELVQSMLAAF